MAMADLNVEQSYEPESRDEATTLEIVFWLVGILAIPLVPILMVWFFTPWSGM